MAALSSNNCRRTSADWQALDRTARPSIAAACDHQWGPRSPEPSRVAGRLHPLNHPRRPTAGRAWPMSSMPALGGPSDEGAWVIAGAWDLWLRSSTPASASHTAYRSKTMDPRIAQHGDEPVLSCCRYNVYLGLLYSHAAPSGDLSDIDNVASRKCIGPYQAAWADIVRPACRESARPIVDGITALTRGLNCEYCNDKDCCGHSSGAADAN